MPTQSCENVHAHLHCNIDASDVRLTIRKLIHARSTKMPKLEFHRCFNLPNGLQTMWFTIEIEVNKDFIL
jgi:hypothetical protein